MGRAVPIICFHPNAHLWPWGEQLGNTFVALKSQYKGKEEVKNEYAGLTNYLWGNNFLWFMAGGLPGCQRSSHF